MWEALDDARPRAVPWRTPTSRRRALGRRHRARPQPGGPAIRSRAIVAHRAREGSPPHEARPPTSSCRRALRAPAAPSHRGRPHRRRRPVPARVGRRRLRRRPGPPSRQGAAARHGQRALPHLPVAAARPRRRPDFMALARPRALPLLDAARPRGHLPRRCLRVRRDAAATAPRLRATSSTSRTTATTTRRRASRPRATSGSASCSPAASTTGTARPPRTARRPADAARRVPRADAATHAGDPWSPCSPRRTARTALARDDPGRAARWRRRRHALPHPRRRGPVRGRAHARASTAPRRSATSTGSACSARG